MERVRRPLPLSRLQDPRPAPRMRYAVHDRSGCRPVAMLGFSTAAWKLAPRDRFIGWTPQLREKNLPLVVDNPRFLILPWIKIPNLGSHILAIVRAAPARGLDRALRHNPRAHRDLRPDTALHRRRLQGIGLDPCRNHPGTRTLRQAHETRPTEKGHLASPPSEKIGNEWTAPGLLDTRVRVFDLMRPPQLERVFPALPGPAFGSRSPSRIQ